MPERVESSVVVDAPVDQVYGYWENLENLPNFMVNVEEVRNIGQDRTHWTVKGPLGVKAEFDAETTQHEPNQTLGWNSVDGNVQTSGQVRFQELGPERTRVEVTLNYWDPPAGRAGEVASRFVANPQTLINQDLQNFKEIMEGTSTPEEIRQRTSGATVQSGAVAFLTSGAGLLLLGGGLLLLLLLRRRGNDSRPRSRIIFEF